MAKEKGFNPLDSIASSGPVNYGDKPLDPIPGFIGVPLDAGPAPAAPLPSMTFDPMAIRVSASGTNVANQYTITIQGVPNPQAVRVITDVLPKALDLYLRKSKDYGGNVMDRFRLGIKASVPDMARKFGKIIDAIWEDKPLQFEQPEEVLMDLLGHIFIILDQMNRPED